MKSSSTPSPFIVLSLFVLVVALLADRRGFIQLQHRVPYGMILYAVAD
jgi:hypothetical protein